MSQLTLFRGRDRDSILPNLQQNTKSHDGPDGGMDYVTLALELVKLGVSIGITYYLGSKFLKILSGAFDPLAKDEGSIALSKKALAKRLKRPEIETMEFDSYEQNFLNDIIAPDELGVGFADIGGMEHELEEVKDNIVLPILLWNKFKSDPGVADLPPCPSGVLLYGNPGTGKSYTAKAIAKEAGATFINIKASAVMDKFLGESDKLVSAIFRLGRKLGPSIIFIDEIETVLRKRDSVNPFGGSGIPSMQGVFLSEWDGLNVDRDTSSSGRISDMPTTSTGLQQNSATDNLGDNISNAPVVVLGATNRPMDLDKAFLRRMPVQIQTRMPDSAARLAILRAQLSKENLARDVNLEELAHCTEHFTGSDLKELIRLAKQQRMKSLILTAEESLEMVSPASDKNSSNNNNSKNNSNNKRNSAGRWSGNSSAPGAATVNEGRSGVQAVANSVQTPQQFSSKAITKAHLAYGLQKTKSTVMQTKKYGTELVVNELAEKGYVIDR